MQSSILSTVSMTPLIGTASSRRAAGTITSWTPSIWKLDLAETALKLNIPLIAALGTGNKLDPTLLQVTDISKTYGCPLARVMRKELRTRGIHHLKVVFSPEKPVSPAQPEAPPPGRRSVPASNPWVPATAGLLLGSAVVRDLIAQVSLPC